MTTIRRRAACKAVTTIGLDIAKSVFQVHGVDAIGKVVIRRQLKRRYVLAFFQKLPPCLVGIEACASSHHWSRELKALGHTVRLMPPAYVKPYVKRQKNDAADAEAICEAVTRANMRFVATKTPEQQSCLMLHRTRHLFIRQQTAVINAIRAHLAEFGVVAPVGRRGVEELLDVVADFKRGTGARGGPCLCCRSRSSTADAEEPRSWSLTARSWPGTDPMRRANGSMRYPASARRWPPLWSPVLQIRRLSDRDGTSRPGSDWYRSSTRAAARTGSAVSASKAIAICAACSRPAHSRSSVMPRSMAPSTALAHGVAGSPANQGRRDRACQQDRQNGLGHDGQGRTLQGTRRACGVTEVTPAKRRDMKVGRANST